MFSRCTDYIPNIFSFAVELKNPKPFIRSYSNLMVHIGLLLSFGVASPPTAAALCVLIIVESYINRAVFGRYIQHYFTDEVFSAIEVSRRASMSREAGGAKRAMAHTGSEQSCSYASHATVGNIEITAEGTEKLNDPTMNHIKFFKHSCGEVLRSSDFCISFVAFSSAFFGGLFTWDMALDEEDATDCVWRPVLLLALIGLSLIFFSGGGTFICSIFSRYCCLGSCSTMTFSDSSGPAGNHSVGVCVGVDTGVGVGVDDGGSEPLSSGICIEMREVDIKEATDLEIKGSRVGLGQGNYQDDDNDEVFESNYVSNPLR